MRAVLLTVVVLLCSSEAFAQGEPGLLDLRIGLQPLTFQPGMTSSLLGSAARVELDPVSRVTLQVQGRLPWLTALGKDADPAIRPMVRGGVLVHVVDQVRVESEDETVRPQDASVVGPAAIEAGHDISTVQQRLGSPRMRYPGDDGARDRQVGVRHMQSVRVFYDFVQTSERLPDLEDSANRYAVSQRHMLSLGYSFGSQWFERPELHNEDYEVGFKRYFLDVMLSPEAFGQTRPLPGTSGPVDGSFFPLGGRIGLEGALCGVLDDMPGLGLSYTLELGALPGQNGIEGYMLIALGLELDFSTLGVSR